MTELIGKSIGDYQLLELIREDEHTLQIKAFQPGEDRYVNFTTLKPHVANDSLFVQQFLNAAQIASGITHANILPVYDYGQHEGVVYRVSPLVGLGSVQNNLGRFYDLQSAKMLISQITDGLAYIYAQGHIHGNLRSSTIFLNPELRPMLTGFGITHPPGHVGNPFLSPEQIQGGVVDQRTDVYALGVLLYELLTGVTPPVGIVVKPSAKRPDLPQAVERVILKAMAQNPDQRFQSPADFNNALQNAVTSPAAVTAVAEPPPATAGVSQSVTVQQSKSTNWVAIILGIILVGVLIGGAILILPRLFGNDEVADLPSEPPIVQPTVPPVEQPPVEQPPIEEPSDPPDDGPGFELPEGLPDFCYSIVGAAGIAVYGIAIVVKKHRRDTYQDD
jgi:serine/threonine-protein kinase